MHMIMMEHRNLLLLLALLGPGCEAGKESELLYATISAIEDQISGIEDKLSNIEDRMSNIEDQTSDIRNQITDDRISFMFNVIAATTMLLCVHMCVAMVFLAVVSLSLSS